MQDIKYPHLESQRIDNFLFSCFRKIPKPLIYKLLRKKNIKLNGHPAKPLERLEYDDIIRVPDFLFEQNQNLTPNHNLDKLRGNYQKQLSKIKETIIYEDDYFFILNKLANLAVHSGSSARVGLIEILKQENSEYELAHRLDKKTTGCLIIAKNRKITKQLHQLFRLKQIQKHYLALCYGHLDKLIHKIDFPLHKKKFADCRKKVEVDFDIGKPSISYVRKTKWLNLDQNLFDKPSNQNKANLKNTKPYSLVQIQLYSGRTHQIRVHLSHLSHPIVGDDRYNLMTKSTQKQQALMLHCQKLVFKHPITQKLIVIEASLPIQFQKIVETI